MWKKEKGEKGEEIKNNEWVNMMKLHFMDLWGCYNRTFLMLCS